MALVLADRVKESTTTTGTGAISLAGAAVGFQTFSTAVGNANTCYYTIADQSGASWEVGIGTYTSAGNTLSRDTIISSSNVGSLVTFSAGTKDVFVTYPAGKALYFDASGNTSMLDGILSRAMLKDFGYTYYNSGTTNALDYTNGQHQRWTPNTGAQTLTITNWSPTGNLSEFLIEGVNLGASTITWLTVNWIKSNGTTTTTFASNGVTLQTSGTDWVYLWTRDAGTTIYGKVVR
jgi:hypothetical protein